MTTFSDDDIAYSERDVQLAWQRQQSRQLPRPHQQADMHGLVQEFGGTGTPLEAGAMAIMVVTKRCRLVEWTLDTLGPGSVNLSIQYAPWAIPRVWNNITGTGVAPALGGQPNASGTCDGWSPLELDRRDALLIAVDVTDSQVEQITLVLYVRELPRNQLGSTLPPAPPQQVTGP
jgi:hypothetical protein